MIIKPQDVVILLKLVALGKTGWAYQRLAADLSMSQSEVHAGVRRAVAARLMTGAVPAGRPIRTALFEFLVHGVRYAYPPERGELTQGVPTACAAPPLNKIVAPSGDPPPVWPSAEGTVRGYAFAPLYRSVPQAAARDPVLYELLALVDAIRDGQARELNLAAKEIESRLLASTPAIEPPATAIGPEARVLHAPRSAYQVPARQKLHIPKGRLAELCRKYHIRKLSLFGSAARNAMTPESDIDLMVEFEPGHAPSLWEAPGVEQEFSALFGNRRVDIVSPEILRNPYRRKAIVPELKVLYEA